MPHWCHCIDSNNLNYNKSNHCDHQNSIFHSMLFLPDSSPDLPPLHFLLQNLIHLTYNLRIICFIGSGCLMLPGPVSTHGSTAFLKIRIKILSAHLSSIKILHIIRNLFLHCIAKRISECAFRHACHYIKFLIAVTYIYQWFCHFLKGVFPGLKFFFQLLYFFFVFIIFTCIITILFTLFEARVPM